MKVIFKNLKHFTSSRIDLLNFVHHIIMAQIVFGIMIIFYCVLPYMGTAMLDQWRCHQWEIKAFIYYVYISMIIFQTYDTLITASYNLRQNKKNVYEKWNIFSKNRKSDKKDKIKI